MQIVNHFIIYSEIIKQGKIALQLKQKQQFFRQNLEANVGKNLKMVHSEYLITSFITRMMKHARLVAYDYCLSNNHKCKIAASFTGQGIFFGLVKCEVIYLAFHKCKVCFFLFFIFRLENNFGRLRI